MQGNSFSGPLIVPQSFNHLRSMDLAHNNFEIAGTFASMLSGSQPHVTGLNLAYNHK